MGRGAALYAFCAAAGLALGLVGGVALSQNAWLDDVRHYRDTLDRWVVMYESLHAACAERPSPARPEKK